MSVLDSYKDRVAGWELVFPGEHADEHAELMVTLEFALEELREKRWTLTGTERLSVLNGAHHLICALGNVKSREEAAS
jgi:hypothetical protein